jgi:FkbM family methyltransferase
MPPSDAYKPYAFAGGEIYLDVEHSPAMLARAEGRYEPTKVELIQRYLSPGMCFVDVGANMGDFSLIAAKTMGDVGRVLAFEPSPDNCMWMRRSIKLNSYECIDLYEMALSDSSGEATLYLGNRVGRHSLVPRDPEHGTIDVPVKTLDEALEAAAQTRVDMVKIDVEGAELQVLRGAVATFGATDPMMVMVDLHPARAAAAEVCSLLVEYGFSLRSLADPASDFDLGSEPRELLAVKGH